MVEYIIKMVEYICSVVEYKYKRVECICNVVECIYKMVEYICHMVEHICDMVEYICHMVEHIYIYKMVEYIYIYIKASSTQREYLRPHATAERNVIAPSAEIALPAVSFTKPSPRPQTMKKRSTWD